MLVWHNDDITEFARYLSNDEVPSLKNEHWLFFLFRAIIVGMTSCLVNFLFCTILLLNFSNSKHLFRYKLFIVIYYFCDIWDLSICTQFFMNNSVSMISKADIAYIRSLHNKVNRQKENVFLVEGWKSISEFLDSNFTIVEWYFTDKYAQWKIFSFPFQRVSDTELSRMTTLMSNDSGILVVKCVQILNQIEFKMNLSSCLMESMIHEISVLLFVLLIGMASHILLYQMILWIVIIPR